MTKPMRKATALAPVRQPLRRDRQATERLVAERSAWLAALEPEAPFVGMFDHLPGVCFFAKDRNGRTMFASRGILERYGMSDERDMLGLTDFDINPGPMAEAYVRDDRLLLDGKLAKVERIELWFDGLGMPDWFVVTKLPLFDGKGRVQGVMGVLRRAGEQESQLPLFQTVSKAVAIIRRDFGLPLVVGEIAATCGVSLRQLQRHFQRAFGISAQEFLIRTRVIAAARLLEETDRTAAEIARATGFVDASSFSDLFRARTGSTPMAYRSARR